MLSRITRTIFIKNYRFCANKQPPVQDNKKPEEQENTKQENILDDLNKKKEDEKSSNFTVYALGAMGLFMGYLFLQINSLRHQKKTTKSVTVTHTGKALIGGPWQLIDTKGNVLSDKDLKGEYYLIYFGFCNCPDVCPNSLLKLTKALQRLRNMSEMKNIPLKTIFVSVDPDRDNSSKIESFLSHFDSSIIGVTGKFNEDPALKDAMRAFKIYATKIEMDLEEEQQKLGKEQQNQNKKQYTLDHTIITYLMDDENNYITHLGSNLGDHDLAKTIADNIIQNQKQKIRRLS